MLTVFVFCTLEGWVDGMYQFQDSSGWAVSTVFHVLMVLLGTFFCMNLALAVIADTFESAGGDDDEEKEEEEQEEEGDDGEGEKDEEKGDRDRKKQGSQKIKSNNDDDDEEEARAPKPESAVLATLWEVSYNSNFNTFITLLILLNATTLALEHARIRCLPVVGESDEAEDDGWSAGGWAGEAPHCLHQADLMSDDMSEFLVNANYVFVVAFAGECAIKFFGLSPRWYFRDAFNSFDFVIVVVSFLEIAIRIKGLTALRCFRVS